jgi:hypothetical protein
MSTQQVDRIEKERAAVLSEASMVNSIEYRVECQLLSRLHSENMISKRFPIGKEELIKKWTKDDLQQYHAIHYGPSNAVLYLVGDVDVAKAEQLIGDMFGKLQSSAVIHTTETVSKELNRVVAKTPNMQQIWRHFPPVTHRWSTANNYSSTGIMAADMGESFTENIEVFSHELLQSFSFHMFAKRPIESITTVEALKREVLRKIAQSALQIRLNIRSRQEPLYTFIDFNQLNWQREVKIVQD